MSKKRHTTRSLATERENTTTLGSSTYANYRVFIPRLTLYLVSLILSACFIPRASLIFRSLPPPSSSLDKPQHKFLEPITALPLLTVAWICIALVILQHWWASQLPSLFGGERRVSTLNVQLPYPSVQAWLTTLGCVPAFFVVLVFFGAPLSSYNQHTLALSCLLSLTIVHVPARVLGTPSITSPSTEALLAYAFVRTPLERAVFYPSLGSALGCWFGAFPLALDWDRPWQSWPLPPAYGALLGYILGSTASVCVDFFAPRPTHMMRKKP